VSNLADRLASRTLELVDIASESLDEAEIRSHLRALVPSSLSPAFVGDDAALWIPARRPETPLVVLAGHYDTVPAQDNIPGTISGDAVHGLGAADMKGGVAVSLELVRDLEAAPAAAVDVALLLFGKEELPPAFNTLPELFDRCSTISEAALAILLEPTAGAVHAGCVGALTANVTFHGVSGHAARPWQADNAIDHAIQGLAAIAALDRREATVGGLPFFETVTLTRLDAGIADNVVPDRAVATVNLRYPPDRRPEEAEALLASLVPSEATIEIVGNSPPAAVVSEAELVRRLVAAGATGIEPKQAWTNVADFTTRGIDAINFGPGEPAYAHRADELVRIPALVHAYEVLRRFVDGVAG
jgi:succinyl-diaminopimelate desuccinylase